MIFLMLVGLGVIVVPLQAAAERTCKKEDRRTGACLVWVTVPGSETRGSSTPVYSDRFGCYLRAKAKQPAKSDWIWEGHTDGFIAECTSASGEVVNISAIWMPGNPMSPAIAAREAVAQLTFTAPAVGFGPAPEINPWGITVEGYPVLVVGRRRQHPDDHLSRCQSAA